MKIELEKVCYVATFIAALVTCLPLSAEPSQATGAQPPSQVVHYADLDLSSQEGARVLYHRIQSAAWHVCLHAVSVVSGIENLRCRQEAVQTAVERVNRPALTAVYRGEQSRALTAHR
jgi:UrcA family protein